jgi:hypothetical protein
MLGNTTGKGERVERCGHQQLLAALKTESYVDGNLREEIELLFVGTRLEIRWNVCHGIVLLVASDSSTKQALDFLAQFIDLPAQVAHFRFKFFDALIVDVLSERG